MARQPNASISKPPAAGPIAGASTTPKPNSPMARPRCSSGKTSNNAIIDSGCITPAAIPCSTRAAMSDSVFQLAAPRSDAEKNKTIVATKVRRWPKVSTSHAVASIDVVVAARKPVATHCNESWPMLNSRISAGNATLTMVAARIVETVATIVVATTQGRREGVAESSGTPGIGSLLHPPSRSFRT